MPHFTRRGVLCVGAAALTPSWAATPALSVDPRSLIPTELLVPLDAELAKHGKLELNASTLASLRKRDDAETPPIQSQNVQRRAIPGPAGNPNLKVYVINASKKGAKRPAILHIHGGGYVRGSAAAVVPDLEKIANELDCVVVSVDYRLAPDTAFPGSLEDNYAALKWLWNNAGQLGVDTKRIAVMGESAGGGHAAMLAIAVRDRKEFSLVAQILIYPMLDDRTGSSRSVPAHIGAYIWTPASNRFGWSSLLGRPAGGSTVPYGSVPARMTDLSRLPPTFIGTGAVDLFVEEDVEYATRLIAAGVPVELLVVPGAYHAFDLIATNATLTHEFRAAQLGALRRAFS
jgi:acetyl esterase/lipase